MIKSKFFNLKCKTNTCLDNTYAKIRKFVLIIVLGWTVQRETQFVEHGFTTHQTSPEDHEVPVAARGALAVHA